jgi:hypothetical protein
MMRLPEDLKPLRVLPKTIDAHCYNLARLALRRLPRPVRVALDGLRGLEILVEDKYWLCVDSNAEDRPILAWTDFETKDRSSLHEPVRCQLYLLHHHSGLVMGLALDALERALDKALSRGSGTEEV